MIDALDRVRARIRFAEEASAPGMLHGAILRSPYAHAVIRRIDLSAALAVEGVVVALSAASISAADAPRPWYGPQIEDQPILATERTRYVGEPVAAVAATDENIAREALGLIEVEYEPLSAVFDPLEAAQPAATLVHPEAARAGGSLNFDLRPVAGTNICHAYRLRTGDAAAEMERADVVVEGRFYVPSAQHVAMEPHATLASWEGGDLVLVTGTQTPFDTRRIVAGIFDLAPERVRVIVPPLGGGYGAKSFPKLEPIAAALARAAGRPVRIVLARDEEFVTANRHASTIDMRIGAHRDGRLIAKQIVVHWNTGAYADSGPGVAQKGGYHAIGPYRIPHVAVDSLCVYTHLPPNGAFRGYSATQPVFATESLMDRLADRLGMDPLELRLRNTLGPGERFNTGETMGDVHWAELLTTAADAIDWKAGRRELAPDGRWRGRGLAMTLKGMQTPSRCAARVGLGADGGVRVYVGTVEMGQGSGSAMAALAADALGQPLATARVVQADTGRVPFDTRTTSSRSSFMMGRAVLAAADALGAELRRLASGRLGAPPGEIRLIPGWAAAGERRVALGELVRDGGGAELCREGEFRNGGGLDPDSGQGVASSQWNQSAVAAQVLVDPETGVVEVEHVHAAAYAGRVINEVTARLQTEGNVVMGLGSALFEEVVFVDGQVANPNLSEYPVPSMSDAPARLTTTLLEREGAEIHGLGETALPPTPAAIANAIAAALEIELDRLPATPERILAALDASRRRHH